MSKNKENRILKSSGILSFCFLILVFVILFSIPWHQTLVEEKTVKARQKAEVLAYQLVQLYQENLRIIPDLPSNGGRLPASVDTDLVEFRPQGLMGIDPWGHPYEYLLQKNSDNKFIKVTIRSSGPDGKTEAPEGHVVSDDVRIVLNIPLSQ